MVHGVRGKRIITGGALFAEVEVDTLTGRVHVLRVVAAHDCGRIMDPLTLRSQIESGIIQAIGTLTTLSELERAPGFALTHIRRWLSEGHSRYRRPRIIERSNRSCTVGFEALAGPAGYPHPKGAR